MGKSFIQNTSYRKGLILDPRTKLLSLITVSTLMLSSGSNGLMIIVKPILSFVPVFLLLLAKRFKTAIAYTVLYGICLVTETYLFRQTGGFIYFILVASCSIMTRFAPSLMTGYFLLATTSVSEFIGAMKRIHMSDKIVIPLSVVFRFIPTIRQEHGAISDAMRMRGIRLGGGNPIGMIEYRIVPLMMSTVKIGEELSATALTRALGSPRKRTNICKIGFHFQDILIILSCVLCFILYLIRNQFVN